MRLDFGLVSEWPACGVQARLWGLENGGNVPGFIRGGLLASLRRDSELATVPFFTPPKSLSSLSAFYLLVCWPWNVSDFWKKRLILGKNVIKVSVPCRARPVLYFSFPLTSSPGACLWKAKIDFERESPSPWFYDHFLHCTLWIVRP